MDFALGFISGIALCVFVAIVLAYFRHPIITMLATTEKAISNAGPRARGFIFEPDSEADVLRQQHIAENAAKGRDTPIEELM